MGIFLSPIQCILWLVVGGIAGSLAHQIMSGRDTGFVQDVLLGLVGAIVGGLILSLFRVNPGGSILTFWGCIGNLVVATFGACVLIGVGRLLSQTNQTV
jgi:uncharacterized membrane protein YeaQ/YmgE (transglycosylase-associated protein family)